MEHHLTVAIESGIASCQSVDSQGISPEAVRQNLCTPVCQHGVLGRSGAVATLNVAAPTRSSANDLLVSACCSNSSLDVSHFRPLSCSRRVSCEPLSSTSSFVAFSRPSSAFQHLHHVAVAHKSTLHFANQFQSTEAKLLPPQSIGPLSAGASSAFSSSSLTDAFKRDTTWVSLSKTNLLILETVPAIRACGSPPSHVTKSEPLWALPGWPRLQDNSL